MSYEIYLSKMKESVYALKDTKSEFMNDYQYGKANAIFALACCDDDVTYEQYEKILSMFITAGEVHSENIRKLLFK